MRAKPLQRSEHESCSYQIHREEVDTDIGAEFTNMVIFCTKSHHPLVFRDAVQSDFLNSRFRQRYLVPRHEVDAARFDVVEEGGRRVLWDREVGRLHKYQDRGALEHWGIMRTVMPDAVWEGW